MINEPASKQTCLEAGICKDHGQEIERRRVDRESIQENKNDIKELEKEISPMKIKVFAMFLSIGLTMVIVLGCYAWVGVVSQDLKANIITTTAQNKKSEELLWTRIERSEKLLMEKIERTEATLRAQDEKALEAAKIVNVAMMDQLMELTSSNAEQKEWRKGVMQQLQLLNNHIRDIASLKYPEATKNTGVL